MGEIKFNATEIERLVIGNGTNKPRLMEIKDEFDSTFSKILVCLKNIDGEIQNCSQINSIIKNYISNMDNIPKKMDICLDSLISYVKDQYDFVKNTNEKYSSEINKIIKEKLS